MAPDYAGFFAALGAARFAGDVETGMDSRLTGATDNSIYRLVPAGAVFPRELEDIARVVQLAASGRFGPVALTARGGGTGTNGQSLSDGIILDCSRHLTRIGAFDAEKGLVTVEPGVVLDQLNAFLAPHGWFFPPNVSTASRATIGGMVATDASGKGSRRYGRTSDYIEALDVVLADGTSRSFSRRAEGDRLDPLEEVVASQLRAVSATVAAVFPEMNRGLTGYNLKQALPETGGFDMNRLLAGSEGTLALTAAITLRLRRKPKFSALAVVFYHDFAAALADVPRLVSADPLAVEILDDKILRLAQGDPIWSEIGGLFGSLGAAAKAVNYVEITGDTDAELNARLGRVTELLDRPVVGQGIWRVVREPGQIAAAWSLRQKAVGLLGAIEEERPGIAFVEDTAVPPERLADYVTEFRAVLDAHGVDYGMFGHADVGCLHVRPTVNLRDASERTLVRSISDAVAALAHKHGGLLWGEHGRGLRGEYAVRTFGPALLPVLSRIKALFDPENRFNPGKLATPDGQPVLAVDAVPFRGARDAEIGEVLLPAFGKAVACNGNGACHGWSAAEAMCPSYKATRDKRFSPKGRATLLREWARLESLRQPDGVLTEMVRENLALCLSCRACASACPVKVDIPTMKSRFLARYFAQRKRPLRHWAMRLMEPTILLARRVPRLCNALLHNSVTEAVMRRCFGLVDLPHFSAQTLESGWRKLGVRPAAVALTEAERARAVVLVPDSFNAAFDTQTLFATAGLLRVLGFTVLAAPVVRNGKALEILGFEAAFGTQEERRRRAMAPLIALGLPLLGLEPAVNAMAGSPLVTLDRFLFERLAELPERATSGASETLLLHCTEKSADPATAQRWRAIAARLGVRFDIAEAGCCGMSGLFGHEAEHADLSRRIFDLSWTRATATGPVLATGFSCRCQSQRFAAYSARHPASLLLERIEQV